MSDEMDDFIKASTPEPCFVCKELSDWVEVNFATALHPGRCADKLWHEYVDALRKGDEEEARRRGHS